MDNNEKILEIKEFFDRQLPGETKEKQDGFLVRTSKREFCVGISNEQQCCEKWGAVTLDADDLRSFIGSDLMGISIVDKERNVTRFDIKRLDLDYEEEGEAMFINFETSVDTLQFVLYNIHNGYYGHNVILSCNGSPLISKSLDKFSQEHDDFMLNLTLLEGDMIPQFMAKYSSLKHNSESISALVALCDGDKDLWRYVESADVSQVRNMDNLFYGKEFDGCISGWDVSNVESMVDILPSHRRMHSDFFPWDISNVKEGFEDIQALRNLCDPDNPDDNDWNWR